MAVVSQRDTSTTGDYLGILFSLTFITFFICFTGYNRNNLISLTPKDNSVKHDRIYSTFELNSIRKVCYREPHTLLTLPPSTICRIRALKLQKRRKRGCRSGVVRESIQHSNAKRHLITVAPTQSISIPNSKVRLMLLNARSIRNKDIEIGQYIHNNNIDLTIITETWINDSDHDKAWCMGTCLNLLDLTYENGYTRSERKGGGIAIVYNNKNVKLKLIKSGCTDSFEFTIWEIHNTSGNWTILGLYHPPQSKINATNTTFLDEFSDFIGDIRGKYKNILIAGDFNIHIDNNNDLDAYQFNNLLDVHGPNNM